MQATLGTTTADYQCGRDEPAAELCQRRDTVPGGGVGTVFHVDVDARHAAAQHVVGKTAGRPGSEDAGAVVDVMCLGHPMGVSRRFVYVVEWIVFPSFN